MEGMKDAVVSQPLRNGLRQLRYGTLADPTKSADQCRLALASRKYRIERDI